MVARVRRCLQTLIVFLVVFLVVFLGLLLPVAAAAAQEAPEARIGNPATQPTAEVGAEEPWGNPEEPENYVPSKGPAEDGRSYNWVQMRYGAVLMVAMLLFTVWLVRRTPRKSIGPAKPSDH